MIINLTSAANRSYVMLINTTSALGHSPGFLEFTNKYGIPGLTPTRTFYYNL